MAPTAQPPPPPAQNVDTEPDPVTPASLANTIHSLRDLIFRTALPKTDKAKNITIAIAEFLHACNLIASTCASLQTHHDNPQINDITKKLDVITARLDVPNAAQPPQPHSYASILATGIKPPVPVSTPCPPVDVPQPPCARPVNLFDFMLVQKSHDRPALAKLTECDLLENITKALRDADCWSDDRAHSLGSDGSETGSYVPCIRAVGGETLKWRHPVEWELQVSGIVYAG